MFTESGSQWHSWGLVTHAWEIWRGLDPRSTIGERRMRILLRRTHTLTSTFSMIKNNIIKDNNIKINKLIIITWRYNSFNPELCSMCPLQSAIPEYSLNVIASAAYFLTFSDWFVRSPTCELVWCTSYFRQFDRSEPLFYFSLLTDLIQPWKIKKAKHRLISSQLKMWNAS